MNQTTTLHPEIEKNQPYNGVVIASRLITIEPANPVPTYVKLYFANILGREPNKAKYEWACSGLSMRDLTAGIKIALTNSPHHGIPHFAVSFPHVTRVYRWGDYRIGEKETNHHQVGIGKTRLLRDIRIALPERNDEDFACPLEGEIIHHEFLFRKSCYNLDDYIAQFVPIATSMSVENPNMIRDALEGRV